MSSPKQWDISRALAIASMFHLFHNIGKFCVIPFLTIYFRQLGLDAPLVGIIMGIKHLVFVFWAPLCSYLAKSNSKRRILIMLSLIFSAGAGLILPFYSMLDKDIISSHCNGSYPWRDILTTPGAFDLSGLEQKDGNWSFIVLESPQTTFIPHTKKKFLITNNPVEVTVNPSKISKYVTPTNAITSHSTHLEKSTPTLPQHPTSPMRTENKSKKTNEVKSRFKNSLDVATHTRSPSGHTLQKSVHKKKIRDVYLDLSIESSFLDDEHKTFLIVLGALIVWEVLAAPLEWTADDSLYEYLDFVDATDRHGKLWIFSYLGACLGSSLIAFVVDNLACFFITDIPRVCLHFFGYSAFMILTLMLSPLYPIHVSKKTEHANKIMKALGLIGNDGRVILLAVTVFLTGAVGSTAQNFLFWKMQDVGSTELYMGFSVTIALLSEIVLYFFRSKLLKALSFRWMVALGLSCLAVQFLYYSFLWTSWAVLPIQLLSAFSNGAMWWAVLSQVDDVATPGTERSLQLVLHCLSYGCGGSIGSFASGFIIRSFSLSVLYQACSITLFLWVILFLLVQPKLPHVKKINYSRLLAADHSDMSDSEEEQERDWLVEAMKEESKIRKW
ncbi:major facilitator superfamily domain-containing protein 6-like isoform 2-T2 [Pelodytes ibericus]